MHPCSIARGSTHSTAQIFDLPVEILFLEPAQVYYLKSITGREAL